jgi:type I restriction enzyme S subunit
MKEGWEIKKFEDCIDKVIYSTKILRKDFLEYGKYPIISQEQDFINGYWDNSNDLFKVNEPIIIFGDHTKVIKYIDFDFVLGADGVKILKPKCNINPRYLYFFLKNIDLGSLGYARHYRLLKEKKILIPPLPEQQRIVSIIDKAFEAIDKAIENTQKNLQNAKELFESYLNSVFENGGEGWEEKTLKEVCAKITDGTHQTPKYFDDGIIFLSSRNVTSGKIDWDNIKYIDEKQHLEMHKRVAPRVGDILLAKNGTTGVAAIVDRDLVFDIYVSLAHIRVLDQVTPEFMLYFINSPLAKKQFNKRLKGSGVPNLHLEEIREVSILFPKSINEQKSLVEQLGVMRAETQNIELVYRKKINNLEELKKSILNKAFAGEL